MLLQLSSALLLQASHTEHPTWEKVLQMNSKMGLHGKLLPHLPQLQAVKPYYTPFANREFGFYSLSYQNCRKQKFYSSLRLH